ncbi:aminopeptidase [Nitrosomonas sp. Nm51]|uniref:aminopeptidase n=1 Tax=Nitrosomonas sp. Nm51 TaxID=133720 RepID=UPI002109A01B|nr:aminopeptidase [Nitrosomonas sp. Nm51]
MLNGCANLGYYAQAVNGHMDVMRRAQPISGLIDNPGVDPDLKRILSQAAAMRKFASEALELPDNQSYTRYADLKRPYAVWNVVAAPEFSIRLKRWCFVKAGCVSYRGFFSQARAERYADRLRAKGYDVHVGGVPAYSTLGWFSDPVLNTFIHSELELARLIFHELAHQVVYVPGDTVFNESFATLVEQEGIRRWLTHKGKSEQYAAYHARREMQTTFNTLVLAHRKRLKALFETDISDAGKRAAKAYVFNDLHAQFTLLASARPEFGRYERWFAKPLNNARLATVSVYTQLLPAFRALLALQDGDMARFYAAVRVIGELPSAAERADALQMALDKSRHNALAGMITQQPQ